MIPTEGTTATDTIAVVRPRSSRTYRLDLKRGRVTGMMDGLEAVRQAVFKILQTPRYEHVIYSDHYGFEPLAGMNGDVLQSELSRRIEEALLQDDRITAVENMRISHEGDSALAEFTVVSEYGRFEAVQEVKV